MSTDKNELVCRSKNGVAVNYDPINSHAALHFESTPQLKSLVVEALSDMTLSDDDIKTHVDLGRQVGTCDVVNVDDTDEIVYAVRKNCGEDGQVPFVKTRDPEPCSLVAMHLIKQADGTYLLSSCWIGSFGGDDEPFPCSPNATARSADFWNKHAFVWGSQTIVPGTETPIRPW